MGGEGAIHIYPRSLCALQQMLSMCLDHVRSSDTQMPRYLKCLTFSIWMPLSENDGQCDLITDPKYQSV